MTRTKSEGLAGFIAFKIDEMPDVSGDEFVFEKVSASEFEKLEIEYTLKNHSAVNTMTMLCGKKRRAARKTSYNKG